MAVAVVDRLEAVDVEEDERQRPLRAPVARQRLLQQLVELAPVREAGERVDAREPLQLLLHVLHRGHVGAEREDAAHRAVVARVGDVDRLQVARAGERHRDDLELDALAAERRAQVLAPRRIVLVAHHLPERPPDRLAEVDAQPVVERAVHEAQPLLGVDVGDQHRQVVGDRAQLALAGLDQIARTLLLAAVGDQAVDADDAPLGIAIGHVVHLHELGGARALDRVGQVEDDVLPGQRLVDARPHALEHLFAEHLRHRPAHR